MTDLTVSPTPQVYVEPMMTAGGNTLATTSAVDGTAWVAFPSQNIKRLVIVNTTGVDVEFHQDGVGSAVTILNGGSLEIWGIDNANRIAVRRVDVAATAVSVKARWEV
jgi:methyl coenzyme M reductase beta subunit